GGEDLPVEVGKLLGQHRSEYQQYEKLAQERAVKTIPQEQVEDQHAQPEQHGIVAKAPPDRGLVDLAQKPQRRGKDWTDERKALGGKRMVRQELAELRES